MKLKRGRALVVPPKIRSFIDTITAVPLEDIEEHLKYFFWDFDKGDFYHWIDLFNHFDSFFDSIKLRKEFQLEDNFLEADPPFPKVAILQILRVSRIILENCTNKHFYSSYEQHISTLIASTDADVVEACLQTLAAFVKKTMSKNFIRDPALRSKLFALAQGWGGKEQGLGLVACVVPNGCDPAGYNVGCTLHFEFYTVNDSSNKCSDMIQSSQGLQVIHLPNVNTCQDTNLELLSKLIKEYKVPLNLRFLLLTRLRFARAFVSLSSRQQYTCIRLYAFVVLIQACTDSTDDLTSFFNNEPELINELVSLLSYEDLVPEKIRILCLVSLVALCQDRSRQSSVLASVTSGGHRGILSGLLQKAIDSVISDASKWSVVFSEALLSLVTVLVTSSSGCSALREAGFIPTLLPLLKDMDPQHLHLVSTAVHILESFMDYSNPAISLFRDLGGLDDTISRLKLEVSYVENCQKQPDEEVLDYNRHSANAFPGASTELDVTQPLYCEMLVSYHRRLLMKALLRAISLGTYAPGSTTRISGFEENLLPQCLCTIFRRAKYFGGGMFSLAATVMSDLIHKDPTCYPVLDAAGLPSAFIDAIMDGILCSAEAVTCIPQSLDALCLNNNGLQAVKDRNALKCFIKVFTSRAYSRALTGETIGSLSSGLDEFMRHAISLRGPGVDVLIEILNSISRIGSVTESHNSIDFKSSSIPIPMETDGETSCSVLSDSKELSKVEPSEQNAELPSDSMGMNVESFLPECISNVSRLLETILQNADVCRIFVEKKGVEAVLKLFDLPLLPPSPSVGQSIAVAFKTFSSQQAAPLAHAVCSCLKEHLKSTNDLLVSIGGTRIADIEASMQTKVLKSLSSLEGILSLTNVLLKATGTIVSELSAADADVLMDLGRVYGETLWQLSLSCDSKLGEKPRGEIESESSAVNSSGRESDDEANIPTLRYMSSVPRNTSLHQWGSGERGFISVVRSGEGINHRRNRHGLTRVNSGRPRRHLEAVNVDSEIPSNLAQPLILQDFKNKSPDVLVQENLTKIASIFRSFFTAFVKGFTSPNRRRADSGISSHSRILGAALAKMFLEALVFSPSTDFNTSLSLKCRYLGKIIDDMVALTFDNRRRTCCASMINCFYVNGTFKELLTTFEATSQLLWSLPCSISTSGMDHEIAGEENNLSHNSWLLDTLQSYCHLLEYFVNSSLILSPASASQVQFLVQPVAVGLSIGLFPVPRDPEVFIGMLQSQVLDVVLPIWNHPMFPNCNPGFVTSIVSLVTCVYSGVQDVKRNREGITPRINQRFVPPPPDESTIATIIEMGFTRERAEEALRRVETNSVEMAMEWLCSHTEDPVQEGDELARALSLSLGNSSETAKVDTVDQSMDVVEGQTKVPPVDEILDTLMKMLQSDTMAFPLTDLLVTLCHRNKGEDRPKVTSFLIQQLKLIPLDLTKDTTALGMISHIIVLLLSEDGRSREIAAQNGIVSAAINILVNYNATTNDNEVFVPKCITASLLILDNLLQSKPRTSDSTEGTPTRSVPNSTGGHAFLTKPAKYQFSDADENSSAFDKTLGRSTGYLTMEESHRVLLVACDMIKHHVPAVVTQAVLQLCARLTKTHALALQFLENGGMAALFSIPKSFCIPGFDTLASAIIRHLLEDPQTLQTAMESEIRQNLTGKQNDGRTSLRLFLTAMAPVISRDPAVFMKAAAAVCQLDSSGGRIMLVLSKEKEKPKSSVEPGLSSNEGVRISENKVYEGVSKCFKNYKKIPANVTQVIDQLLEILFKFPSIEIQEDCMSYMNEMEVDEPDTKKKGKSKVGDVVNTKSESLPGKSEWLAKVTFVFKLLSDALLMYAHVVGVILKKDTELCQSHGSSHPETLGHGGVFHHVLYRILPLSIDKIEGHADMSNKLSEKASWFLVVLCGRSSEGRRRVIHELVKAFFLFSNSESNSLKSTMLPDKKVFAYVDLSYSIMSKNSSSGNLPGSVCSPDIAKSMIDGGMVHCLTNILQVIDLDHPGAPKLVNLILKALESLTRAANANDQVFKSDLNKKRASGSNVRSDDQLVSQVLIGSRDHNVGIQQEHAVVAETEQGQMQGISQSEGAYDGNSIQHVDQDLQDEVEETMTANPHMDLDIDFMHAELDGGVLNNNGQLEMNFHVDNRDDEEDDDMGDEGEDEDEDDEGDDEDEDIAEDGAGLMSLADTDAEDHDDPGFDDEYPGEDDDYHENGVIEVRWSESLDGIDHFQVLGQSGASGRHIDITSEPFEGVNVDDLFGVQRPLGFERRRHTVRTSFDRPITETNSFQHPLLTRPSQSGNFASSRDLESLSSGNFDVSQLYMFEAPVIPHDAPTTNVIGEHFGSVASQPLTDYSVGMESLQFPGRRGTSDSRWTDDGQPQASSQATAIAQAVEVQFLAQLRSITPLSSLERQPQNSVLDEKQESEIHLSRDGQMVVGGYTNSGQREGNHESTGNETPCQQNDHTVENVVDDSIPCQEYEAGLLDNIPNASDNMDIVEGNVITSEGVQTIPEPIISSTESHGDVQHEGNSQVPAHPQDMSFQSVSFNGFSRTDSQSSNHFLTNFGLDIPNPSAYHASSVQANSDVDMSFVVSERNQAEQLLPSSDADLGEPSSRQNIPIQQDVNQTDQIRMSNEHLSTNSIDPAFLEALPEDLRAEVLASQQALPIQAPTYSPPSVEDIDPEFLAALPPNIQAEVLAQQRAQRVIQQAEGQPVDMDNASIIATFPADLREEVLLTSSEAVLSALPSPLLAEAQMLRDRAMSHYQALSIFGSSHRLSNRRNGLGLDRHTGIDRGIGVTIGRRAASTIADRLRVKEIEGEPLVDANALKALIRLLRLTQPLGKGLLQRLLLNLCAHSGTRAILVHILLDMMKPEAEKGSISGSSKVSFQRLYGCQSTVGYSLSQLPDGLPPLVLRRILEILTYLASNRSAVATGLFYFDSSLPESSNSKNSETRMDKGKEKIVGDGDLSTSLVNSQKDDVPVILFLKMLNQPLFLRSIVHLEQVMGLLRVVVYAAASNLLHLPHIEQEKDGMQNVTLGETSSDVQTNPALMKPGSNSEEIIGNTELSNAKRSIHLYNRFLQLPQSDLHHLCSLLGREGLSDKVYLQAGEVLKKLASVAAPHRRFFISELSELAHSLSILAVYQLITLRNTNMSGLSACLMAGASILRVLQTLSILTAYSVDDDKLTEHRDEQEDNAIVLKLNVALEPLWKELSNCISMTETQLGQSSVSPTLLNIGVEENAPSSLSSSPLPPGTQRLLPFIESFFVLCGKLQANTSILPQDHVNITAIEVKESTSSSSQLPTKCDESTSSSVSFSRFAEKHRRLLNTFIRQNPGLLEKSLSMMLKTPRLIDFDNKRAYFRSRIRLQHEHNLSGPLRISVRRAYVLEDSYNQLRMRPNQDLKGRLNVHFQGEEGIDAGGLTREWYQLLSRVIFDKGALLFTTVGNDASFQPNPNSVYQTEHLSYFKFVGRVVAKALFDGQLLDVHFTRSFYKHILGIKVTYHDIEAVDPSYYKNLKWMLENDVSDIPDLTFSMDADEEKHILYEKGEVTDYELKPEGRNIRVMEETKHEYVDLVADHILTNAIRPQINSFLDGFSELAPHELISIFNDKELELLISGLPEIDLDDLKAHTEYTGYIVASNVVQWFWDVVKSFTKEDMAKLLQFVTGTSKVPLEGFKALQGISGPQRFQIHKAYGAPERLPSAHTCFNQIDIPEYSSKEQLQERLLLAIHEGSEGFGFG